MGAPLHPTEHRGYRELYRRVVCQHECYHAFTLRQLTLRVDDVLANRLKDAALERRQSVNAFAQSVLAAAVDPQFADGEAARLRERLARAGLLETPERASREPPSAADLARARGAAGRGEQSLADLVSEGRD